MLRSGEGMGSKGRPPCGMEGLLEKQWRITAALTDFGFKM